MKKVSISKLGGLLGDLIAQTFALVTENEEGSALQTRLLQIRSTIKSLLFWLDALEKNEKD